MEDELDELIESVGKMAPQLVEARLRAHRERLRAAHPDAETTIALQRALARALHYQDRHSEAADEQKEAANLAENAGLDPEAQFGIVWSLGYHLANAKRMAELRVVAERALHLGESSSMDYRYWSQQVASLYLSLGDRSTALPLMRKCAIEEDAQIGRDEYLPVYAWFSLANALAEEGEDDEALGAYERAIELHRRGPIHEETMALMVDAIAKMRNKRAQR